MTMIIIILLLCIKQQVYTVKVYTQNSKLTKKFTKKLLKTYMTAS